MLSSAWGLHVIKSMRLSCSQVQCKKSHFFSACDHHALVLMVKSCSGAHSHDVKLRLNVSPMFIGSWKVHALRHIALFSLCYIHAKAHGMIMSSVQGIKPDALLHAGSCRLAGGWGGPRRVTGTSYNSSDMFIILSPAQTAMMHLRAQGLLALESMKVPCTQEHEASMLSECMGSPCSWAHGEVMLLGPQ